MSLVGLVAVIAGAAIVEATLVSAIRTVVVPQGEPLRLTRVTFLSLRTVYGLARRRRRTEAEAALVFGRYGPIALVWLAFLWAVLVMAGFTLVYWGIGSESVWESFQLSGSSFTTLGSVPPANGAESVLSVLQAVIGLGIIAMLISYLPTIYGLFGRREAEVVKLDVRAGSPPTALEMMLRFHRIGWLDDLDDTWADWESWFSEVEESHTSHPSLVWFRSRRPESSWITCAGAVLDGAALSLSLVDAERGPQAAVTIRSGYLALRSVAGFFGVPFDPDPAPNDPISIHRQEFELLADELEAEGVPVVADREQAWRDFAGWRVNYDTALVALCALCDAPAAPWSSDRMERFHRPTLRRKRWVVDPPDTPPSW